MQRTLLVFNLLLIVSAGVLLEGCAGSGPYRKATDEYVSVEAAEHCTTPANIYRQSDIDIRRVAEDFNLNDAQRDSSLGAIQHSIERSFKENPRCWETAHEAHPAFTDSGKQYPSYDLFYAEFDDAGLAVDRVRGSPYEQSELHLIEDYLLKQVSAKDFQGLNIVVFAHGWHGSARAKDTYSIEFKGMLQDIAQREITYSNAVGTWRPAGAGVAARTHRTIGIEIAWRGDSILFPKVASVWDRKLAAETVSMGAVHQLLAFLNQLYLDNSCHGANAGRIQGSCDRIHLLTVGHSYGALIVFRSLVSRLQSGLNVDNCYRAYGFGDMTVLLNPAFESARYRSLFNDGVSRSVLRTGYYGDPTIDHTRCQDVPTQPPTPTVGVSGTGLAAADVQIPTVVTLQSRGDSATGTWFPVFRHLTTPFAKTLTAEESQDKNTAIGWNPDFRTHELTEPENPPLYMDRCDTPPSATAKPPPASPTTNSADNPYSSPSGRLAAPVGTLTFCPFAENGAQGNGTTPYAHMLLSYSRATSQELPNYFPLWSVQVSQKIMKNHDDFWNPRVVQLISTLFEDAYKQTEYLHHAAPVGDGQ
jgi:hypothetical protein